MSVEPGVGVLALCVVAVIGFFALDGIGIAAKRRRRRRRSFPDNQPTKGLDGEEGVGTSGLGMTVGAICILAFMGFT